MKILKNNFFIVADDDGCELTGELIVELEEGETADDPVALANQHAKLPQGVSVRDWAWSEVGTRLNFSPYDYDGGEMIARLREMPRKPRT